MLVRSMVVIVLIATLATTIVQAGATLARARVHRVAAQTEDALFAQALRDATADIAGAIAAGADPRTVTIAPSPAPSTCAMAGSTGCALSGTATVETTTAAPVSTADEDVASCQPRCADNVQENDAISEGRIAVAIAVSVTGASGEVFAHRERDALFRTLRVPPYAALVGIKDATDEAIAAGASAGDDAGLPATVIDVRYVNAQTGASTDANVWQSRGWSDGSGTAPPWDP